MIYRVFPKCPKNVHVKQFQSRKEWEGGRDKIGGSDAAAVVGMNPYMSNHDLWEIKTGIRKQEDISDKPYVRYGNDAEDHLRKLFSLDYPQYSVGYFKNNMITNDLYPFAHASLDGWLLDEDGARGILEIKTTNILQSMQKEKWKDRIPDNYFVQVLHYLMVTEFNFVVLKAQLKTEFDGDVYLQTKHYRINREDVEDDIRYLAREEEKFWELVKTGKEPALRLPEI